MPLAAKSTRKQPRNTGKLASGRVQTTLGGPTPIGTKAAMVTGVPPNRSASRPPNGRESEPTSAPRKARDRVAPPTANVEKPGKVSATSFGKTALKPMKEPKVPM